MSTMIFLVTTALIYLSFQIIMTMSRNFAIGTQMSKIKNYLELWLLNNGIINTFLNFNYNIWVLL